MEQKNLRYALSALLFIGCVAVFFGYGHGNHYRSFLLQRCIYTFIATLGCFSFYIVGFSITRYLYRETNISQIILSFAIGIYICCTAFLILGYLGILRSEACVVFLLACNALAWREWRRLFLLLLEKWQNFWGTSEYLEKILWSLFLILLLKNWLFAFTPPLDYDVLEYHLGAPGEYFKAGKIFFWQDNVYANFPQNMEIIAFFYMQLCGSKLAGAICAKVSLWICSLFLMLAVYSLARHFINAPQARIAALLTYALPWTGELLHKYYVEIPLTLFLLTALHFLLLREASITTKRCYFIVGWLLGIAMGVKYTALFMGGFAILPLLLRKDRAFSAMMSAVVFLALGSILGYLPWAIRNFMHTGNPIYPLFNNIIIPGYWSEIMYAKFRAAHASSDFSLMAIVTSLKNVFFTSDNTSLLHLSLLFPAIWMMCKELKLLLYFVVVWIVIWLGFTHRIERFLYPVWVIMAIAMAPVLSRVSLLFSRSITTIVVLVLCIANVYHHLTIVPFYQFALGFQSAEELVDEIYPPAGAEKFLNEIENSGKVLMIGEARVFYLQPSVVMNTVFDRNITQEFLQVSDKVEVIAQNLKQQKIAYLYINWQEIERFQKTYSFVYQGQKISGFHLDFNKLLLLLNYQCVRVFPQLPQQQRATIEVYAIR